MVYFVRLQKTRISQRGAGTKYYIDCSKYSENADSIQTNVLIRNTNHTAILKAVVTDDSIKKKNKHIVVKIMRSSKSAEREFIIGEELYRNKLEGFIKYICLFSCYDTTSEDHSEITARDSSTKLETKICTADRAEKNEKKVLVMPYIRYGSVEDYNWNLENVYILKNILIQAVLALSTAYDNAGFLHGDLHLGNILFKETKKETITYSSNNLGDMSVTTYGFKVVIMDFEKSEIHVVDNSAKVTDLTQGQLYQIAVANTSFWDNIYMMLNRVNTLPPNNGMRLNWEDSEIIQFVKEAKKRKYQCVKEHITRLHKMIENSEFEFIAVREYKYNADDLF